MAMIRVRLADGSLSGVGQIVLTEPEKLLSDGRIIPFLSKLTSCTAGGSCAWELLFTSAATEGGVRLQARLISHTSLQRSPLALLESGVAAAQEKLLEALRENDIAAQEAQDRLPAVPRMGLITLHKGCAGLLSTEVELTQGQIRQHLCAAPGNGLSLLLVRTEWLPDELDANAGCISAARKAQLARDPLFSAVITLWGPDAQPTAAWLQGVSLGMLRPFTPADPQLYPLCLRNDPWKLLTLLPQAERRPVPLTLSELLTACGCPAEPGEMQRMCRTSWRDDAREAFDRAQVPLIGTDLTLQPEDLTFLGLRQDSDLTTTLRMSEGTAEMLRMCVMILRQLGVIQPQPVSNGEQPNHLMGYLLPTVGHIYEQLVRECCYHTMYEPYYAYATGRKPRHVTSVILSTYDQGPGCKFYTLQRFAGEMKETEMQSCIRERMIDDFAAYATVDGCQMSDVYWYNLFNDMNTARSQRNEMAHEAASISTAAIFAKAFLQERPGEASLLKRLLKCRRVETNFPQF